MHPAADTMSQQIEAAIQRKVDSYKTWRAMGVCHQDAVGSILQNSCWGPKLRNEVVARCEALGLN